MLIASAVAAQVAHFAADRSLPRRRSAGTTALTVQVDFQWTRRNARAQTADPLKEETKP
jgi:hypothetical protein